MFAPPQIAHGEADHRGIRSARKAHAWHHQMSSPEDSEAASVKKNSYPLYGLRRMPKQQQQPQRGNMNWNPESPATRSGNQIRHQLFALLLRPNQQRNDIAERDVADQPWSHGHS
jgi:hypothetical protein